MSLEDISMNIYQPYTYLLLFKPTKQVYYGVSYANSKKVAHPSQLWNTYFTSSRIIKQLITEHGVDSFDFQIRNTFTSAEAALAWERKILKNFDAKNNPKWLNLSNGTHAYCTVVSPETRLKISIANKGKIISDESKKNRSARMMGDKNPMYGKISAFSGRKHTQESIDKQRAFRTGRKVSDETKQKLSKINKGKSYEERHGVEKAAELRKSRAESNRRRKVSDSTKALMSLAHKNRSPETRKKLSDKAKNRPQIKCPHCNISGGKPQMMQWHFDNCKMSKIDK